MQLKGAIFDMDGTLVDSMSMWKTQSIACLQEQGIRLPDEIASLMQEMTFSESLDYLIQEYHPLCSRAALLDAICHGLDSYYASGVIQLKPYALAYLQKLRHARIPMCIVTANTQKAAHACLSHLKIEGFFTTVLSCKTLGTHKRSPYIYQLAAEQFALPPQDIAVFEDALYAAQTAKAAGFYTVGIYDALSQKDQSQMRQVCDIYLQSFQSVSL